MSCMHSRCATSTTASVRRLEVLWQLRQQDTATSCLASTGRQQLEQTAKALTLVLRLLQWSAACVQRSLQQT
eukprot:9903-Heterococcus_DN1.PRE.2